MTTAPISKVDACNATANLLVTDYDHDRATVAAWSTQIADLVSNTVEDLDDECYEVETYAWALADTIHGANFGGATDEETVNRVHELVAAALGNGGRD